MIRRKLGFAGIILAVLVLVLYLAGGEKIFRRLGVSRCEKLWDESEEICAEGEVYKKTRKEEKLIIYLKKIRIRDQERERAVASERLLVYLNGKENAPGIGQRVYVRGKNGFFEEATNPGNFDQKKYYKQQNIQAVLRNGVILEKEVKRDSLREKLWQIRERIADLICRRMGKRRGGILCSILLGDSAYTEEEIKEIYRSAGIGHLLAISGLHISFFGTGVYQFLRKTGIPVRGAAFAGSVFLCMYVLMTGMSVSAVRALVMFLLRMGAEITGREYDGLTALGLAEILLLIANPLQLFQASFQLSFVAVFGIYLTGGETGEKSKIRSALEKSVRLQVFLLPVTLWHYYETCLYAPVWNIFVIPMATLLMFCGSAGIVAGFFMWIPGKIIQSILWKITEWILIICESGSDLLLELPGARWIPGRPEIWQIIGYYSILALLIWKNKKQHKRKKKKGQYAVCAAGVGILLLLVGLPKWKKGQMRLTMLDVGQGDCFFFQDGTGKNYLIDGGSSSVEAAGQYRIEPFLKSQGVKTLDYVWVTHGDADHMNGIEELLEREKYGVKIQNLILPEQAYWDEKLYGLAECAETSGSTVYVMERDAVFISGKLKVRCLWPDGVQKMEDSNENSMVLDLAYGKFAMLFTGDLENAGEELVIQRIKELQLTGELPKKYDLLKLGHHGSKNATGEKLLQTILPDVAFCSAGKRNRYGHPHAETLERLAKWDVSLYNTKDRGAVSMYTDGRKYGIKSP